MDAVRKLMEPIIQHKFVAAFAILGAVLFMIGIFEGKKAMEKTPEKSTMTGLTILGAVLFIGAMVGLGLSFRRTNSGAVVTNNPLYKNQ
jgi:hypothetical protein